MSITSDQIRMIVNADEPNYRELAQLGPDIIPTLGQMVAEGDSAAAPKALYLASLINAEGSTDIVELGIRSTNPLIRIAAAGAVRNFPEAEAIKIGAILLEDGDVGVRRTVLDSLSGFDLTPLEAQLHSIATSDEYDFIRNTSTILLNQIQSHQLFKSIIVPCGATGTSHGCGSNPAATDPLIGGSVTVDQQGAVVVRLLGAAINTTYTVFVGIWLTSGKFQTQFAGTGTDCGGGDRSIGTIITDGEGNFEGRIRTAEGEENFVFPSGTKIDQLKFAFNNPPCTQTQFTTQFTTEITIP